MNKDKALLMAVEAMQFEDKSWECEHGFNHDECPNEHCIEKNWFATIQACKKALEQPAQSACEECLGFNKQLADENDRLIRENEALRYKLSDPWKALEQPAQEPVAWIYEKE